ncbi:MAG TPA: YaeQ family protein [Spongiibacteraceae bacterium]
MAQKATIFKAELNIADMNRNYFADHSLTIARHPSETDERMMVRVLAFALQAHAQLQFTRGLSADDEADIWKKDLTGALEVWVDVGLPDEKRVRKACHRARAVFIYAYGGRGAALWWQQNAMQFARFDNLTIVNLAKEETDALAALAERTMQLQCTVQDDQVWLSAGEHTIQIHYEYWQRAQNV